MAIVQYSGNQEYSVLGLSINVLWQKSFANRLYMTHQLCGPGWKNQLYRTDYYLMNGICYWVEDLEYPEDSTTKLLPLIRTNSQAYDLYDYKDKRMHKQFFYAYGQAGFSAHIVQNNSEILLGAPGVFLWAGSMIEYKENTKPSSSHYVNRDSPFSVPVIPNPINTVGMYFNSYFGYAVSSGKFFGPSGVVSYVSGAPRAGLYHGKVYITNFPVGKEVSWRIWKELVGLQFGEYFGSAICTIDINSDGFDDLVVGAPLHSSSLGDEGAIYVYINDNGKDLVPQSKLEVISGSQSPSARFGSAIAHIGDINRDGYTDIAVGAPWEQDGYGAVYIYHGGREGLETLYSQCITALQVNTDLRGFGYSITRGRDVDNNQYNDIGVGAFDSGHSVVIRSHPVIQFFPQLLANTSKLPVDATEFHLQSCLRYSGEDAPTSLRWHT